METKNVEIFKTCTFNKDGHAPMSFVESELIIKGCKSYRYYEDCANDMIAFALDLNREDADKLVNELNEIDDSWYLGDEDEEYVFVD
jgi:hypothetical protein